MPWGEIIVGALSLLGALIGALAANRKTSALLSYRLTELEEKVDKHNRLVERTYKLEERAAVLEEGLREANRNITELRKEMG